MRLTPNRPIWRPYTQEKIAPSPIEITRAADAHLYTKSGQTIFDGISSWWLITHGHCHPAIVEAVQNQAGRLDQVTFGNFTHEPAEELADLLMQVTPPELTRVFFTDNGSTAVEAALKMALQACAQTGHPHKQKFLAFEGAYHGDTVGAMSVSGDSAFNRPYKKTLFEILRAKHPTVSSATIQDYIADFDAIMETHHQTLAAVIVEPLIQGAGGMIVWPDEAVQHMAKVCKKYGVYLIFDEVMTGFGRTGAMFAMDRLSVIPDIICLSKGLTGGTLPLAVTLVREEIYQAFLAEDKSRMFFHGHSFTGNPISCAAAVANIKVFRQSDMLQNLARIEEIHRRNSLETIRRLPLVDSRICGTMAAIEIDIQNKGYLSGFSAQVSELAMENGLFIRPLGNIIYLLPPYCSSAADLDQAWQILSWCAEKAINLDAPATIS